MANGATHLDGADLHAAALERFEAGAPDDAIELLRRAAEHADLPELVNDLAVVCERSGASESARELLLALRHLAPDFPAARENTEALAVRAATMRAARERLLQVVAESATVVLADNLDVHFHPFGHALPDRRQAGARLAAQLDVLERAHAVWSRFGDEESRELFLRLLAYRALGPAHVRLQLDPSVYHAKLAAFTQELIREAGVVFAPGAPLEWQLHEYDLTQIGFPVHVVGPPLPLASTFLFSQYAHRDAAVPARPMPGDVAVDGGGCWGDTALWLAHMVGPEGRVHTFEPARPNRELMAANLRANSELAERIHVHDAPLAARTGESVWIPDSLFAGNGVHADAGEGLVEVSTQTVDDLVGDGVLPRVDFIKLDVEHAELDALRGAAHTIRTQRPRLAIAAYHRPDDLATLPAFIESLGVEYRWYLQCSTMVDVDVVAFAVPA